MRRVFGMLLLMATMATPSLFAQGGQGGQGGGPGGRGGDMGDRLATELGLDDDQKAGFQEIMKESQESMRALREDKSLSKKQVRTQMKEIQAEQNSKLEEVLGKEKYAQYEEMQAEMEARRQERMDSGEGGGPGGPGGPGGGGPGGW